MPPQTSDLLFHTYNLHHLYFAEKFQSLYAVCTPLAEWIEPKNVLQYTVVEVVVHVNIARSACVFHVPQTWRVDKVQP